MTDFTLWFLEELFFPVLVGVAALAALRLYRVPWKHTVHFSVFLLCLAGAAQDYANNPSQPRPASTRSEIDD